MKEKQMNSLLLSAKEAAKLLSISCGHFWGLHNSGRLGPMPIKLGRRTLWSRKELEAWVAADCLSRRQWVEMKKVKAKVKIA
jgi:predicted DNA-binding transcriptional regulator AlpA